MSAIAGKPNKHLLNLSLTAFDPKDVGEVHPDEDRLPDPYSIARIEP